ncbi:MAG: hypothetical protein FOGNACKC_05489 [Anaerolineae bacterium]|nr:hypothetical protein [Anaerolineae bacterium]
MLSLNSKRKFMAIGAGLPLILGGGLLLVGLWLAWPPPAYGQNGPYSLVIEGRVTRQGGAPGMLKPVALTTALGETLETKTDADGYFTLTGSVEADGGLLEVRSGAVADISFGQMAVTWAAGGPGEKRLTVNLITDGKKLWSDATEPPYPAPLPGETIAGGKTPAAPPVTLPTTTPPTATPVPQPEPPAGERSATWVVVALLVGVGLIAGLALLAGGLLLLRRNK